MNALADELAIAKSAIDQAEQHLLACKVGGIVRVAAEEEHFRRAREMLLSAQAQCALSEVCALLSRALEAIPKPRDERQVLRRITRFGRAVEPDAVFDAWTGQDLDQMRAVLDDPTNAIDRGALLGTLVNELYRRRADPAMREELFAIGRKHLEELPALAAAQLEDRRVQRQLHERRRAERAAGTGETPSPLPDFDDRLWHYHVSTFLLLVRAYCEIEKYEAAKAIWHDAHRVGYLNADGLEQELEGVEKRRRKNDRARQRAANTGT